jgi:hypothetical protein
MTLRVVADNVTELPVGNLMDIPGMSRRFANDLEAGDYGDVQRVMVVIESGDGIRTLGWGDSINTFEAIGLLEAAKIVSFSSGFDPDD